MVESVEGTHLHFAEAAEGIGELVPLVGVEFGLELIGEQDGKTREQVSVWCESHDSGVRERKKRR